MRRRVLFALFLACLWLTPSSAIVPDSIEGTYRCEGLNPDGSAYLAVVQLTPKDDVWVVQWKFQEGEGIGLGIRQQDTLAVIFQLNTGEIGMVTYAIGQSKAGDTELTGKWLSPLAAGIGSEVLTKVTAKA